MPRLTRARMCAMWAMLAGLAGCMDYGLDGRRFTCAVPADCGDGWTCAAGFCARPGDGGPDAASPEICGNGLDDDGDGLRDCADPDCGTASCDDHDACTSDACRSDGTCEHTNLPNNTPCGTGCACRNGVQVEKICDDGLDDDGDGQIDCQDLDCSPCMGAAMCCPSGACALTCP